MVFATYLQTQNDDAATKETRTCYPLKTIGVEAENKRAGKLEA